MLNDYTVNITYKNRALEPVGERSYPFESYCAEQKFNITRTLIDIENAFYRFEKGKPKELWDKEEQEFFQHIRHKLLDVANNIERLPQNLCRNGVNINSMKSSEYFAGIIAENTHNK